MTIPDSNSQEGGKVELLPCPFCGKAPRLLDLAGWELHCDCGVQLWGPMGDKADLVAQWNTRPSQEGRSSQQGEVQAWMWQHEETGNTGFVDVYQVENGWQHANPRLKLIRPLVFQEGRSSLSVEPSDMDYGNNMNITLRAPLTNCAADRDGDCDHPECPQLRDGEPKATGRSCPRIQLEQA